MAKKKRRSRGGRPRKEGLRLPHGRLRRCRSERLDMTAEHLAHRVAIVGADNARRGDAGWYIGQLFLRGLITEHQRDVADRFQRIIRAYGALLLVPRRPSALVGDMSRGPKPDDPEEFEKVKSEYEQCYNAVASCGRNVLRAVIAAIKEDGRPPPSLVRVGLEALRMELE